MFQYGGHRCPRMLTAWAGGPKAESLLADSRQTRIDGTSVALTHVFGRMRILPRSIP